MLMISCFSLNFRLHVSLHPLLVELRNHIVIAQELLLFG